MGEAKHELIIPLLLSSTICAILYCYLYIGSCASVMLFSRHQDCGPSYLSANRHRLPQFSLYLCYLVVLNAFDRPIRFLLMFLFLHLPWLYGTFPGDDHCLHQFSIYSSPFSYYHPSFLALQIGRTLSLFSIKIPTAPATFSLLIFSSVCHGGLVALPFGLRPLTRSPLASRSSLSHSAASPSAPSSA